MSGRAKVNTTQMGLRRLAHLPLPKDFCFDVNGEEYHCSKYVAAFISQRVAKILEMDHTYDRYRINVPDKNKMFKVILQIVEGVPLERDPVGEDLDTLMKLAKEIGNDEVKVLLTDFKYSKGDITPETVVERAGAKQKEGLGIEDEIEYIACHFADVAEAHDTKLLTSLGLDVMAEILDHKKLVLRSEDQLLKLILAGGPEFRPLLEFVEFQYLSTEAIAEFTSNFDMSCLTGGMWMSICRRMALEVKPESSSRFEYVPPKYTEFKYEKAPFKGIMAHLREKCKRNPVHEGLVAVRCSTSVTNGSLENLFDYDWSGFVATSNTSNSWYCIDMMKYQVALTAYTLKSRQGESNNDPVNWVVEGSTDNLNWTVVDTRQTDVMKGSNAVHTFELKIDGEPTPYRYIRFRQPAHNSGGNDFFNIANIELFGRLFEMEDEKPAKK